MLSQQFESLTHYSLGSGNDSPYKATMYFFYTILANPEVEPHAPTTYQSKLVTGGSIDVRDPHLGHE